MGFVDKFVKRIGGDVARETKQLGGTVAQSVKDIGKSGVAEGVKAFGGGLTGGGKAFLGEAGGALAELGKATGIPDALSQLQQLGNLSKLLGGGGSISGPSIAGIDDLIKQLQATTRTFAPQDIQASRIDPSILQASRFLPGQERLAAALEAQAQGTAGPSLAEQLLRSEQDRILNQQLALAATIGGRALPTAQRQVMQQQALGAQEAARQGAILRAQEQQRAQEQLASVLAAGRQSDIAARGQEQALAEANAQLQQQAAIEAARQAQAAQFKESDVLDLARQQEVELKKAQLAAESAAKQAEAQRQAGIAGGLLGAGGSLGAAAIAASDKTLKHNIKDVKKRDLDEFFKAMKPQSYRYNNSKWGEGDKVGFMMQDIEKTKLGKMISRKLPDGKKGYDPQGLQGILLAKFAMEQKKKEKKG